MPVLWLALVVVPFLQLFFLILTFVQKLQSSKTKQDEVMTPQSTAVQCQMKIKIFRDSYIDSQLPSVCHFNNFRCQC